MSKMKIDGCDIDNAKVFEILLDSFPDIIHSANDEGNIVFTNKKAEELLGYTRAELLTMNVSQIYAATVLSEVKTGFEQLKEKGVKSVESLIKDRKGNLIPVEIRSFAIYDDNGKFIRTFSILRDIRPLKELQASLVHASRLAAVGELASGIMHDIANPLSIIMMATDLCNRRIPDLPKDPQAAEDVNGFIADIQKAAQRIEKLVDHMRRYVRNRAEVMERVDLGAVVADALFIAGNKISKGRVKVESKVPLGQYWVNGCPNRLEQVFVNLVSNAADAMEQQAVRRLSIEVAPEQQGQTACWRISVTDTGTGIPAEIQNDIFQSFFTTKEKGKGTGLGLSIVRSIMKDHRGDIRVESEVGHGATFHVVLPTAGVEPVQNPAPAK